jgi:predicted NBD/HSP70 family sugar kinase
MTDKTREPELSPPAALPEIPAENLTRWHAAIADELRAAFEAVLPVGKYTLGAQLAAFEAEFAAYAQSSHAIGISSGTAALHLALRALGVGPGDEVVTVPNTYVATDRLGREGRPSPRTAADVFRAARGGDADARRLIADGEAALARAFAALIATLDPERIVVGGSLGLAHRTYVSQAGRIARQLTIGGSGIGVPVVPAELRHESVLAGAAVLAAARAA